MFIETLQKVEHILRVQYLVLFHLPKSILIDSEYFDGWLERTALRMLSDQFPDLLGEFPVNETPVARLFQYGIHPCKRIEVIYVWPKEGVWRYDVVDVLQFFVEYLRMSFLRYRSRIWTVSNLTAPLAEG
jgi:hypothetical protein